MKKSLLILILISLFNKNIIDITIINLNTFYTAWKLKKTYIYIYIFLVKNIEFQVVKKITSNITLVYN